MISSEGAAQAKTQRRENKAYVFKCVSLCVLGLEVSDQLFTQQILIKSSSVSDMKKT